MASLESVQRPLLEPLAGKVIYDERATARISSPVSGRVLSEPAPLGKHVTEGSPLVELNSPDVAAAIAEFVKAEADVKLADRAYSRQKALYEGNAAARKEMEQAFDELARSQSEAARTRDRLKNLRLNRRQADGKFALRSPISGIVVERHITPGMEVRPDLPDPLFVVSDLSKLLVQIEIFEVNFSKIKPEQRVLISVPAYPDEQFPATVKYIGQILDENTRTVMVRCELPNPDKKLLPGMYATVNILSDPEDKAIVVPLTAVFTEDESDYVFVSIGGNRYHKRAVKIGLRLKDKAVVEEGLKPGENLVVEGALMLRTEEAVEESSDQSSSAQGGGS
ncbi:efflux RND transporter periplasmic adaptor subunit [Methylomicrobium sp. Wu6]|nr:efflux RND transporter periplasmic adaptor subunit [Methylomicrobium sp. Wu6]